MTTVWTLIYTPPGGSATTKTLEDWGIASPRLEYANQQADTLQFTCPDESLNEDPQFEAMGLIELHHATLGRMFMGWVVNNDSFGSERDWGRNYQCNGPWWKLDETVWAKSVYVLNNAGTAIELAETTNFLSNDSTSLSVKEQIAKIILFATQVNIPIGLDAANILPNSIKGDPVNGWEYLTPQGREVRDMTCGEAIRMQLRWLPSAVTWFDYSVDPPMFHCKTRPGMTAVDISTGEEEAYVVQEWSLRPRYDLTRDKVMIRFQKRSTFDGKEVIQLIDDVYPVAPFLVEPHALVNTIDLKGPDFSQTSAEVTLRTVPWFTGVDSLERMKAFWKEVYGQKLKDPRVSNFTVDPLSWKVQRMDGDNPDDQPRAPVIGEFDSELIDGQIPGWMQTDADPPGSVQTQQLKWFVNATWEFTDDSTNVGKGKVTQKVSMQLEHQNSFCNIPVPGRVGRVYSVRSGSATGNDEMIVGLAQALWNQLHHLQYDGNISLHSAESVFPARMGNTLNLLGERPQFAAMAAQIQGMTVDLQTGTTNYKVGPANALGTQDLVELLM